MSAGGRAAPVGRRLVLGGLGAGLLTAVTGGRWLPRLDRLFASSGWRIYNVAGRIPSPEGFRLQVEGMVARPFALDLAALRRLPQDEQVSDFECVTGWRVENVRWRGVRLERLLERARPQAGSTHITFHSRDGVYVNSLSVRDALAPDTMLALEMDGEPLPLRHGGPARMVVPSMYGYKGVKWVGRLELTDHEVLGYWEQRGYRRDGRIVGRSDAYDGTRTAFPLLALSVDLPPGWRAEPDPARAAVSAVLRPPGTARVEVSLVPLPHRGRPTREETQALLTSLERAGLQRAVYGAIRAGTMGGDTLQADGDDGQRYLFAFFPSGRRILQLQAQAPVEHWFRWEPTFIQLLQSVRTT